MRRFALVLLLALASTASLAQGSFSTTSPVLFGNGTTSTVAPFQVNYDVPGNGYGIASDVRITASGWRFVQYMARVRTSDAPIVLTNGVGYYVAAPSLGANTTLGTLYGLFMEDQTGAGDNYAIYTQAGKVRFGGDVTTTGKLGVNGKEAQPPYTLGPAATDLASTVTLVNNIRAALIANGIGQ